MTLLQVLLHLSGIEHYRYVYYSMSTVFELHKQHETGHSHMHGYICISYSTGTRDLCDILH